MSKTNESPIKIDINPLIRSIADRNAVVFVGAGASIPAGLPSWKEFLKECLEKVKDSSGDENFWKLTENLLEDGDYLTAAELLQRGIGTELNQYIWSRFTEFSRPSEIHKAIARIPFSLAITTNYDRLLESAYTLRPNVWTWNEVPQELWALCLGYATCSNCSGLL